jgi:hypothetical protein
VSGEIVTYTYDTLNRLASAVTSDNPSVPQWGQSSRRRRGWKSTLGIGGWGSRDWLSSYPEAVIKPSDRYS